MDRIGKRITDAMNRALAEPVVRAMMESIDDEDEEAICMLAEQSTEIVAVYAVLLGTGMKLDGRSDEEIREMLADVVVQSGIATTALRKRRKERIGTEDEYRIVDDEE